MRWSIILFVLCGCLSQKPKKEVYNKLELKPDWQLNYNLAFGDERYQFIVHMMQMNPDRVFRYTMTNKSQTSANITLTAKALESARRERNTFNGKNDTLSDNELTVWISKSAFRTLQNQDTVELDPNYSLFGEKLYKFYNGGYESYSYELNGFPQNIEVMKVVSDETADEFLILNDPENPLIIRMKVKWEIWLKEINHN